MYFFTGPVAAWRFNRLLKAKEKSAEKNTTDVGAQNEHDEGSCERSKKKSAINSKLNFPHLSDDISDISETDTPLAPHQKRLTQNLLLTLEDVRVAKPLLFGLLLPSLAVPYNCYPLFLG
uniref:Uncharacterized protein n=1 Tax=Syphacia muris TaxID=451379 RepID=A0A0N5B0M3_9BILA